MKILSLSDTVIPYIYSPQVRTRFSDADLILGCGDLDYFYIEYVFTALDVPLFYVRGNHDKLIEYGTGGQRTHPNGGIDLHRKNRRLGNLLLAGVEGSLRYRKGEFQYTQAEMWWNVFALVPGFFINRLARGRFVDIFVAHAPPAGIHDRTDLPHQGIKAFRWLIEVFRPRFFFHGHIHIHRPDSPIETTYRNTMVINTYGYHELEFEPPAE
jgi:Icc-related predicted phosphoesterase